MIRYLLVRRNNFAALFILSWLIFAQLDAAPNQDDNLNVLSQELALSFQDMSTISNRRKSPIFVATAEVLKNIPKSTTINSTARVICYNLKIFQINEPVIRSITSKTFDPIQEKTTQLKNLLTRAAAKDCVIDSAIAVQGVLKITAPALTSLAKEMVDSEQLNAVKQIQNAIGTALANIDQPQLKDHIKKVVSAYDKHQNIFQKLITNENIGGIAESVGIGISNLRDVGERIVTEESSSDVNPSNARISPELIEAANLYRTLIMGPCDKAHRRNRFGMVFCNIPTGSFEMGSPEKEEGSTYYEGPQHHVNFTDWRCNFENNDRCEKLEMMATEVTQAMWTAIMGTNPSVHKDPRKPVENVTWHEIKKEFLPKLNRMLGDEKYTYRLPTEAEWEYAARGETTGPYGFYEPLERFAWFRETTNSNAAHPVGELMANKYGLFDMHGNISEWVEDALAEYLPNGVTDPFNQYGDMRVIRGGSWRQNARFGRSAMRNHANPGIALEDIGFRLVRTSERIKK